MADLIITEAAIAPQSLNSSKTIVAGEAISIGQPIYMDATDSNRGKVADKGTVAEADVIGLSISGAAAAGQPISYLPSGDVDFGAILSAGETYVLSSAGGISPVADLLSTEYVSYIGYGKSSSLMGLMIQASGTAKA